MPTPPDSETLTGYERSLRIVAWAEHHCGESAKQLQLQQQQQAHRQQQQQLAIMHQDNTHGPHPGALGGIGRYAQNIPTAASRTSGAPAAGPGSRTTPASSLPPPSTAWVGCKTFPYEPLSLVWNAQHTRNTASSYCYCGKNLQTACLQCRCCRQWFHTDCCKVLGKYHAPQSIRATAWFPGITLRDCLRSQRGRRRSSSRFSETM